MKIIFLSVLASTVLSVFSFKPSSNPLNAEKAIITTDDANKDFLDDNRKAAINPEYVKTGILEFHVTPNKLEFFTGHGSTWYELRGSMKITRVDPKEWKTVHFDHFNDYTNGNFYGDDFWFDDTTGEFSFLIRTNNGNAAGFIDFIYTYEHDPNLEEWPEPVDDNGIVHKGWTDFKPSYGEYVSNDIKDFEPKGAKSVVETFTITGNLENVFWWDYIRNFCIPPEKDSDWYRFEVKQTIKYSCKFTAPNSHYTLTLHKARFRKVNDYSMVTKYNCNGSKNFDITLNAGTYFIRITMNDKSQIDPNMTYKVNFTCSQTNNYFPLYYNNLKNFKALVWESDFIPDNITNRWSSNHHELRWQKNDGSADGGYYDNVFDESYLTPTKTLLDSVIYIWGKDEMIFLLRSLDALETLIHDNIRELERFKQITADIKAIASGVFDLALTGLSIAGGVKTNIASTVFDGVDISGSVLGDLISIGTGICDLVLGTVPEEVDYYQIQDNALGKLIGCLDGLKTDPEGVIAIPVYADITYGPKNDFALGERMSWTYNRSFVPYQRKYVSRNDSLPLTNVCELETIEEVQRLVRTVSDRPKETIEFHGSLKSFKSMRKLKDYINYDYIMEGNI